MGFLKDLHERRIAAEQEARAGQPVVITIARDYGAEGHEIGKMLSVELGIPLYDNELLVRSATRSGEALDKVAEYDERMAAEFMAFLPDRADARTVSDLSLIHISPRQPATPRTRWPQPPRESSTAMPPRWRPLPTVTPPRR